MNINRHIQVFSNSTFFGAFGFRKRHKILGAMEGATYSLLALKNKTKGNFLVFAPDTNSGSQTSLFFNLIQMSATWGSINKRSK